jgi:hypothetical protein
VIAHAAKTRDAGARLARDTITSLVADLSYVALRLLPYQIPFAGRILAIQIWRPTE